MENDLSLKEKKVREILLNAEKTAIAFSGGVDSALLIHLAHKTLGANAIAVTVQSEFSPDWEIEQSCRLAKKIGIRHILIPATLADDEEIMSNPPDRCYACKKKIFSLIFDTAHIEKIHCVMDGSNASDTSDYRPGTKACKELGVVSPFQQADLTKDEVRTLSRQHSLPTWNSPSYACLASRIPYRERITQEKLTMIEQAEDALHRMGLLQSRVRCHGNVARLELPRADFEKATGPLRKEIIDALKSSGFAYVALDLEGFRSGSLNETLSRQGNRIKK